MIRYLPLNTPAEDIWRTGESGFWRY
jgi:hypothetical protein